MLTCQYGGGTGRKTLNSPRLLKHTAKHTNVGHAKLWFVLRFHLRNILVYPRPQGDSRKDNKLKNYRGHRSESLRMFLPLNDKNTTQGSHRDGTKGTSDDVPHVGERGGGGGAKGAKQCWGNKTGK